MKFLSEADDGWHTRRHLLRVEVTFVTLMTRDTHAPSLEELAVITRRWLLGQAGRKGQNILHDSNSPRSVHCAREFGCLFLFLM